MYDYKIPWRILLIILIIFTFLIGSLFLIDRTIEPTKTYYKMDVKTLIDINNWIHSNIEYKSDDIEYWQLPNETLKLKTGDCEDMAILFEDMASNLLKKEVLFLFTFGVNDIRIGHVMILYEDTIYDPQSNMYFYIANFPINLKICVITTRNQLYEIRNIKMNRK